MERSLGGDDEFLVRSCLLANEDPAVKVIEQEWDEIRDTIEEPWSDAPCSSDEGISSHVFLVPLSNFGI